jgi:hypothetical protein
LLFKEETHSYSAVHLLADVCLILITHMIMLHFHLWKLYKSVNFSRIIMCGCIILEAEMIQLAQYWPKQEIKSLLFTSNRVHLHTITVIIDATTLLKIIQKCELFTHYHVWLHHIRSKASQMTHSLIKNCCNFINLELKLCNFTPQLHWYYHKWL